MTGLPSGRGDLPWLHTEGIGAARVDTPSTALKSEAAPRRERGQPNSGGRSMTDAPKNTP